MKLLHTSDLHLCSPLTTRLSADKVRIRRRELMNSFLNIVEYAKREGVRGFIIAGDLFDSESVSLSAIKDTLSIIGARGDISFYYLYGNHELDVIKSYGIELPKNLFVFSDDWTYYELDGVTIAGRCKHSEDMFRTLSLDEGKKNIVILHGALVDSGATLNGNIPKREIEALPIDYLALGHYHTYSSIRIGERCIATYPGIPEGRGFDEWGEKGVALVELDGGKISSRFVKTAKREIYTIDITIGDGYGTYETDQLIAYALRVIPKESLVRVTLKGERSPLVSFDMDVFKDRYSESFFYIEFKNETRIYFSPEEYMNDKTLKGEFIRGVMADESLTDEEREKIIIMGLRALHGESFD